MDEIDGFRYRAKVDNFEIGKNYYCEVILDIFNVFQTKHWFNRDVSFHHIPHLPALQRTILSDETSFINWEIMMLLNEWLGFLVNFKIFYLYCSSVGCHEDGDKNSDTWGSAQRDQTGNAGLQQTKGKGRN